MTRMKAKVETMRDELEVSKYTRKAWTTINSAFEFARQAFYYPLRVRLLVSKNWDPNMSEVGCQQIEISDKEFRSLGDKQIPFRQPS